MNLKNNPTLKSSAIRVGLTIGDPAGIGPAIVLKAIQQLKNKFSFTIIGDSLVLAKAAKLLKIKSIASKQGLIDLNNPKSKNFVFGKLSAATGKASLGYLDIALRLLKEKKIDCLVTAPISKEAINLAGLKFSGHTEYLAKHCRCNDLVMMLINEHFKFSLVTRHLPLKDVVSQLSPDNLESNILNTIKGLKLLFSIKKPKLVICALNPHASDNGVIGTEEQKILIPVIKRLRKKIKSAVIVGPFSADLAITQAAKKKFDCVIALYHDQALIPLKLTGFDGGVNLTLGLPFVRTSPLHGTAFDIAGNPRLANANSLIAAIKLAVKCTQNQRKA
jgi:4-hydroxythreonine-4-phosphate dehydrogenase